MPSSPPGADRDGPTGKAQRRGRPSQGVRERVLAAAEEILAEAGSARLSTKDVARRAGVAESSIFYHFTDRLGLLHALVAEYLPSWRDLAVDLYRRAGSETVRENLIELLRSLESFYIRVEPLIAAVQADRELAERLAERGGDMGPHRGLGSIARYLARERELGRIRADLDVEPIALVLAGAVYQRVVLASFGSGDVPGIPRVIDALLPSVLFSE